GNKTTHLWLGQLGLQRVSAAVRDDGILRSTIPAGSEQSGAASDAALDDVQRQQIDGYADIQVNGQPYTVSNYTARQILNLADPVHGPIYGSVLHDQSDWNAAYNALLVSAQHRLSQNFSIQSNFTWSHCMDDGEIGQDISASGNDPAVPKDWGNCGS